MHCVIRYHVQHLHVSLDSSNIDPDFSFGLPQGYVPSPCYSLPHGIFSYIYLVSLTLEGVISFQNVSSVHLPALRILKLSIDGVVPFDRIFSGYPILEELTLNFNVRNESKIIVPNSVKRLTVDSSPLFPPTVEEVEIEEVEIEIDTPALKYLSFYFSSRVRGFTVNNLHNVVDARLNFENKHVYYLPRLLNTLDRVKWLRLDSSMIKTLIVPTCYPSR
ncbi:hypothetical protein PIB30_094996 [Stylosanthes scabra]|uniref:Uncharacterized protein n=1 Tax=Stylosanthes scabra TaxID=79078 RepID=A0ABU6UXD8_9FABA|nr:hypothetical protein [Stylosanthes scabra]